MTFRNVPAFATHLDAAVEVPQLGTVTVDVAYGGMFYVIADAEAFGFRLTPDEGRDIARVTEMIKAAAAEQLPVVHPEQPGVRRDHDRPAVGAGPRSGERDAERRDGLDRRRSTGTPGDVDRARSTARRAGPGRPRRMATLHARGRAGDRRGLPPRGDPRDGVHGPARRGDDDRGPGRGRPVDHRPGVDHGVRRATSSTRRTRSRTASRSATSGPDARGPQRRK